MPKRRPAKPSMRVKDGRQQPFSWFPNEIMRDHGAAIGPHAGWVYMALLTHVNKEGVCWPAHVTLATMTGMSVAQVKVSLNRLRDLGLIAMTMRRPKTSVYTVLDLPAPTPNSQEVAIPIATPELLNSQEVAINSQDVAIEQPGGSYEVDVSEVDPPNQIHRTRSSSSPPPSPTPSAPIPTTEEDEEDRRFAQFMDAYPRRYKLPEARQAFREAKIDDALLDTILKALQVQIPAWRQRGMRVGFPPADYLRDRMWREVTPEAPQAWPSAMTDEAPPPPVRCKDETCEDAPGRYSRKWCDAHVLPQLQEEVRQVAEKLRLAYSADDPALQLELDRLLTNYHEREPARDLLTWILLDFMPGALPDEASLLARITEIQAAYVARQREAEAARQPHDRTLELVI